MIKLDCSGASEEILKDVDRIGHLQDNKTWTMCILCCDNFVDNTMLNSPISNATSK